MKLSIAVLLTGLCGTMHAWSQTIPEQTAADEMQLEHYVAHTDNVPEDDHHWQQLQVYTRHKINLNTAGIAVLRSLQLLSPLQLEQFIRYRRQMGKLLSVYELQAIPGFDAQLISKLLPYVRAGNELEPDYSWKDYIKKGENTLLWRYGRQIEKSRGYLHTATTTPHYMGSPDKLLLRYRYNLTHYISWGIVMEKDAGEAFLKGAQQHGFDFYSMHLFISKYRCVKALAIGDFTVNMGQGLLNWQSLAFGKGAAVMSVKREGDLLKPYASAGEYNFFRGLGITIAHRQLSATAFVSGRQLDGSITGNSGYHRTAAEAAKQGTLSQFTAGGNISVEGATGKLGFNFIQHHFSTPVQKGRAPYQLFAFEGNNLSGVSTDYEITWRNMHFFGEVAISNNGRTAILSSLLISAGAHADLVLLHRRYDKGYHALYADAFAEFYKPVNEEGLYTGISVKLSSRLRVNAYADHFIFPWLQYRAAAPASGSDHMIAMTYTPDKQTEFFLRYSRVVKEENSTDPQRFIPALTTVRKRSWRLQYKLQPAVGLTIKSRIEVNNYMREDNREEGWLLFQEMLYQFQRTPLQLYVRYTRFMTDGSKNTLYTITTGMLYEYALSRLSGEGHQFQCRVRWKWAKRTTCWFRYELILYADVDHIGNGWEEVNGRKKSALQCQIQHLF